MSSPKRVYSAPVLAVVEQIKNILVTLDIPCEVRGEHRVAGSGVIPWVECWPEVWVLDPSRIEEAEDAIKRAMASEQDDESGWACPNCHEDIEGQFTECWECGSPRPER